MPGSPPESEKWGRPVAGRRPTGPSVRKPPPPGPLGLPDPVETVETGKNTRSRSPLGRTSYESGEDDDHFTTASSSKDTNNTHGSKQSISKVASAFLRVGTLVGSLGEKNYTGDEHTNGPYPPLSPGSILSRLTDAELEAEALREKERSRLEAERILTLEADDRRQVEERILSRLKPADGPAPVPSSPNRLSLYSLPTPTTPTKEGGWMTGLMKKLTPTKDLTPAQQIINDTKARDKEREKEKKHVEKQRSREFPPRQLSEPSYLSLGQPGTMSSTSPSAYSNGTANPPLYEILLTHYCRTILSKSRSPNPWSAGRLTRHRSCARRSNPIICGIQPVWNSRRARHSDYCDAAIRKAGEVDSQSRPGTRRAHEGCREVGSGFVATMLLLADACHDQVPHRS